APFPSHRPFPNHLLFSLSFLSYSLSTCLPSATRPWPPTISPHPASPTNSSPPTTSRILMIARFSSTCPAATTIPRLLNLYGSLFLGSWYKWLLRSTTSQCGLGTKMSTV
ncbi:hypothetical protein B0H14DRAFT_3751577, partial [Mycena olivaceomarginata]